MNRFDDSDEEDEESKSKDEAIPELVSPSCILARVRYVYKNI